MRCALSLNNTYTPVAAQGIITVEYGINVDFPSFVYTAKGANIVRRVYKFVPSFGMSTTTVKDYD